MKAEAFKKYRTYLSDEDGKRVMVQLDLRNKEMKSFHEAMAEDFEDTLVAMERQDEAGVPWEIEKAELETKLNTK